MSHEETVVRTAYAKFAYAVDLNTVYTMTSSTKPIDQNQLNTEINNQGLRFQLSDFKTGNLADLADQKYSDAFPQYPDGQDIIQSALSTPHEAGNGTQASMEMATARWIKGPSGTAPDLTVRQMMPVMQKESGINSPLVRYCTFTVTATLAGRSRTYEAYFLFAQDGEIVTGDVVSSIGAGPLSHFASHSIHPDILLHGSLSQKAAVRSFLESSQRPESSCTRGDVCCDLASLRCGVSSADLRSLP